MSVNLGDWLFDERGGPIVGATVTVARTDNATFDFDEATQAAFSTTTDDSGYWEFLELPDIDDEDTYYDITITSGQQVRVRKGGIMTSLREVNLAQTLTTAAGVVWNLAASILRLPSGTSDQDTPSAGQIMYRSDTKAVRVYNGTAWHSFADLDSTQTLTNKTLTSPTISGATVSGTTSAATLNVSGAATLSSTLNVAGTTTAAAINASGNVAANYLSSSDGSNGIVSSRNGSMYVRSSGGANGVIMDVGSGGLNVTAGPIVSAGGISAATYLNAGTNLSGTTGDVTANRGGTGYVFLGDGSHYIGFDGTQYQMPTSALYVASHRVATEDETETLTNKTLTTPVITNGRMLGPASFNANGNDLTNYAMNYYSSTVTLPTPSAAYNGVFRAIKAYGAGITVNCGSASLIGPGATSVTSSFTLNNGDSATCWCDGTNWWAL